MLKLGIFKTLFKVYFVRFKLNNLLCLMSFLRYRFRFKVCKYMLDVYKYKCILNFFLKYLQPAEHQKLFLYQYAK
jgi:hypothetical protein